MKKTLLLFATVMLVVTTVLSAQILPKRLFPKDPLAGPAPLRDKDIVFLTPSLPVNFSKLEKDFNNKWQVGSAMSIGASYSLVVGHGLENTNGSVQVEPYFNIGLFITAGISEDLQSEEGGVAGSFAVGGMIGLYKYVNIAIGYDFVTEQQILGLGTKIEIVDLMRGKGTFILGKGWD